MVNFFIFGFVGFILFLFSEYYKVYFDFNYLLLVTNDDRNVLNNRTEFS